MLINLDSKKLNYGIIIGFELSRLEWLWNSDLDEAKAQLTPSIEDLLSKLPKDLHTDNSFYEKLVVSIFNYFFSNDIEKYYAIRIGLCIQRCTLYGTSNNDENNAAILTLAQSALDTIPNEIINKSEFIKFVIQNKNNDIWHLIEKLDLVNQKDLNPEAPNRLSMKNNFDSKKIFISYRRETGIDIAARVKDFFSSKGFNVFYDITSMELGEFDKQICQNINASDYFIVILSPNALDRCFDDNDWVRKEIEIALNNEKIKIIPLILPQFKYPKNLPASVEKIKLYHGVQYDAVLFELVMDKLVSLIDNTRT